ISVGLPASPKTCRWPHGPNTNTVGAHVPTSGDQAAGFTVQASVRALLVLCVRTRGPPPPRATETTTRRIMHDQGNLIRILSLTLLLGASTALPACGDDGSSQTS